MKTSMPAAKINGTMVHGQAICNPGINNWIGICLTGDEQLTKELKSQNSIIVMESLIRGMYKWQRQSKNSIYQKGSSI